ncbi:oxaloacetate decarboxylase subunit alpha [Caldicellulosiruptor acetigenus]|uniref:Conserved carboxylase region n=1 Tax=Caldicellulosiruptor acetigenus 6A TaxID=632516 RepID=G2PVR4_9FIRM|nr:oxaloacetate decarboxylase subunit alpha [Caldicellulosiruptor acetigenus]AEM72808.1 Conserved carboxylase region [Caldicellulosiruptor acetigenus 6A]
MKRIFITETVLRDAQQSLIATRMPYEDFEGILEKIDKAGYYSIECWGGATFDSCLRYLNEDPWERLRKIKSKVKNTKLQMLLRGQNLLGYRHYPDDVVRMFVRKSIENGMDIIRIFDALNDLRNIEVAVDETIKAGGHAQGTIVYTISPIHSLEMYVKIGKELESMGVHSICIKDMAGIMSPKEAYEFVKALKENARVPVFLHTHSTTGLGILTYLKAVEAGVDGIDTAISSFSGGTSQPPTETLNYALKQMGYDTNLNDKLLKEINDFFKPVKDKFINNGILNPFVLSTDTDALIYQIPGGMLSNLIAQLKQQNALDKLEIVLLEVPKVREDLGYPPLVTPMSQMVGTQASANVLSGERYKVILKEVKAYIRGEYGRPPGKINPELVKKVLGSEKPIEGRFADTLEPIFEKTKEQVKDFAKSDEDVLSYILFPQVAEEFLKNRGKNKLPKERKIEYTIEGIS